MPDATRSHTHKHGSSTTRHDTGRHGTHDGTIQDSREQGRTRHGTARHGRARHDTVLRERTSVGALLRTRWARAALSALLAVGAGVVLRALDSALHTAVALPALACSANTLACATIVTPTRRDALKARCRAREREITSTLVNRHADRPTLTVSGAHGGARRAGVAGVAVAASRTDKVARTRAAVAVTTVGQAESPMLTLDRLVARRAHHALRTMCTGQCDRTRTRVDDGDRHVRTQTHNTAQHSTAQHSTAQCTPAMQPVHTRTSWQTHKPCVGSHRPLPEQLLYCEQPGPPKHGCSAAHTRTLTPRPARQRPSTKCGASSAHLAHALVVEARAIPRARCETPHS
jgi:outer membrane lipoprotein SlyB